MPTSPSSSSPSAADRRAADRATVRELVQRVGRWRLRFDVHDVRAEMQAAPWLALHAPQALALRLRDLESECLTRVDGTFAFILAEGGASAPSADTPRRIGRGGQPGARVTHQYVLRERAHELRDARPEALDDLERVVLAVAAATLALGGAPAPTRLITAVLSAIPDLALQRPTQQTNVLLARLTHRESPLLAKTGGGDARSARWSLVAPLKGIWLDWVRTHTARHESAFGGVHLTAAAGGASHAELAAALVAAATRRSVSSHWTRGHPVSARDIATFVAEARTSGDDPLGLVPLAEALTRQGVTLTAALQAATRLRFGDGTTRRATLVRRVEHARLPGVRYVSAEFDEAVEHAWLEWNVLRREARRPVLEALADEWTHATAQATSDDLAIQRVGVVRQVAIRTSVEALCASADALHAPFALMSGALARECQELQRTLRALCASWPSLAQLQAVARDALAPTGVSLPAALDAPRSLVSAETMASWLPTSVTVDLAPSVLAATAITVRRAAHAQEERATRVGQGRVERLHLDRADAVHYAADTARLPGSVAIQLGRQLLGAFVSHVGLVRRVIQAQRAENRVAAYGALLLLGDDAYLGALLRKRARALGEIVAPLEATSIVELAWWLPDVRADLVAAGLNDPRQAIKAAARRATE